MVYIEKEKKKEREGGKRRVATLACVCVLASYIFRRRLHSFLRRVARRASKIRPHYTKQVFRFRLPTAIHAVFINFYLVFASLRVLLIKTQMTDTHFSL